MHIEAPVAQDMDACCCYRSIGFGVSTAVDTPCNSRDSPDSHARKLPLTFRSPTISISRGVRLDTSPELSEAQRLLSLSRGLCRCCSRALSSPTDGSITENSYRFRVFRIRVDACALGWTYVCPNTSRTHRRVPVFLFLGI